MALISIYDLNGVEHQRETVDARELEALGWTREPKSAEVVADEKQAKKPRKTAEVVADVVAE